MRSTQLHHQANEYMSSCDSERFRAVQALRQLQSETMLAAKKPQDTHVLSNEVTERRIQDYVATETASARKWVEDADAAVEQGQDDTKKAENAGLTNREP